MTDKNNQNKTSPYVTFKYNIRRINASDTVEPTHCQPFAEKSRMECFENIRKNELTQVIRAIRRGLVDPHLKDNQGNTIFHQIAQHKRVNILINVKPFGLSYQLTVKNSAGETPLFTAIRCGSENMVSCFLTMGASIHVTNKNNENPLQIATDLGNEKIIRRLLDHADAQEDSNVSTCSKSFKSF